MSRDTGTTRGTLVPTATDSRGVARQRRRGTARPSPSTLLAWFTLVRGAAQVLAPHGASRGMGLRASGRATTGVRLMGLRQVVTALVTLGGPTTPARRWLLVAGDVVDLAVIGATVGRRRSDRAKAAAAMLASAGMLAMDVHAAARGRRAKAAGVVANAQHVSAD